MTVVAHEQYQARTLPTLRAQSGKSSSWLGTCCGTAVIAAAGLLYLQAALPLLVASAVLRVFRPAKTSRL